MGNGFRLFFSAALSFCAFVLAAIACSGSTANYNPINKIFVAQVDLEDIDISTVIPAAETSTLSGLELPEYFNIGLWSYCLQASNGTVISCTKPSGIQDFNLETMLRDNIDDNEVTSLVDNLVDIVLPDDLKDKTSTYNNVVKAMFITLLIGICLTFLAFVVNIVRWVIHAHFLNWVGRILSLLGFLSLLVSGATSLGSYLYVRHLLKENSDGLGITLSVGRVFQGILWGSIFSALLGFILWCTVRSPRRISYVTPVSTDEKPLLV